jgi:dCTP deaminase
VILSDRDLRRALYQQKIVIDPVIDLGEVPLSKQIQPAGIDVRLSNRFRVFDCTKFTHIDPLAAQTDITKELIADTYILQPGHFVLGSTLERITLPDDLAARIEGKSSNGRLGIQVHSTAGFIDPGFKGNITLEISNIGMMPVFLWPDMWIGQLSIIAMSSPSARPYGHPELDSKYQGQDGPSASLGYKNYV